MPPGKPMKMPKSVIDLIWSAHLVALLVVHREFFPRIGHALRSCRGRCGDALRRLEHHDFDFVAQLHDLGRMHVLVGPVHLGDCTSPSMPDSISTNAP